MAVNDARAVGAGRGDRLRVLVLSAGLLVSVGPAFAQVENTRGGESPTEAPRLPIREPEADPEDVLEEVRRWRRRPEPAAEAVIEAGAWPTSPAARDGRAYPVSRFTFSYYRNRPGLPPLAELLAARVPLIETPEGLIGLPENVTSGAAAGREGVLAERIGDLASDEPRTFYGSAISQVAQAVTSYLNEQGIFGVFVLPATDAIDPMTGADLRGEGATTLPLVVYAATVSELRTIASGSRFRSDEDRVNAPRLAWMLENSPIRPSSAPDVDAETAGEAAEEPAPEERGGGTDLIQRRELDAYVYRLNRHPGRRVDVAIAPAAGGDDTAELQYLVTENRPLTFYAQISNTGTEQTSELRERFGLTHSQLTNHDDILFLEYITSNFEETHAVIGSYTRPLGERTSRLSARVFGSWSEFTASDVGLAEEEFTGESWRVGAELIFNAYQKDDFFVDAFVGFRWTEEQISNEFLDIEGEEDFFLPRIGVRAARERETSYFDLEASYEFSLSGVTGVDSEQLTRLGRLNPDDDWQVLRVQGQIGFFLEPLLKRREFLDLSDHRWSTLAHEVVLRGRAQYAFDNRLIPSEQDVVGGLYSVRGYPESVAAGDSSVVGSLEYRLHVPRLFRPYGAQDRVPQVFGRPFRGRPQGVLGATDWDLVLKAFVDAGRVWNTDREVFEEDQTLVGYGVGAELRLWRNVTARVDWGFVGDEIEGNDDAESGDSRVHFAVTVIF